MSVAGGAGAAVVSVEGIVVVVDVVVVVEVVLVESVPLSLLAHATASVLTAKAAAMPVATRKRRELRSAIMLSRFCVVGFSAMRPRGASYPPTPAVNQRVSEDQAEAAGVNGVSQSVVGQPSSPARSSYIVAPSMLSRMTSPCPA